MGGYEPARKKGVLAEVQQRDATTLLPIIQQWVAPGSTVWCDMLGCLSAVAQFATELSARNC